jgi:hypothetical protein
MRFHFASRASVAARAPSRENRAMGCVTSRDVDPRGVREETREGDARGREDAKAREEDEDEVESSRVRADVSEETRAMERRATENGRSSSDGETTEPFAWVPVGGTAVTEDVGTPRRTPPPRPSPREAERARGEEDDRFVALEHALERAMEERDGLRTRLEALESVRGGASEESAALTSDSLEQTIVERDALRLRVVELESCSGGVEMMRRLKALEDLMEIAKEKTNRCRCEDLAHENKLLREIVEEVKRDARRFCDECEIEADMGLARARAAVEDARRTMKDQSLRYEKAVDDERRNTQHAVAMATLKSKSDSARSKLRAKEAIEECESYKSEISRLRDEIQRLKDALTLVNSEEKLALATSQRDALATHENDDVSTVSNFGRDGDVARIKWRLFASETLRNAEMCVVKDAEESLESLAELRIKLEESTRDNKNAVSTLEEMNSLLIESRDEVYDLKRALRDQF